jgi:hypothetical protein
MIRPELLPDELLHGYLGRVLSLNTAIRPLHLGHALKVLLRIANANEDSGNEQREQNLGTALLISISGLEARWVCCAHTVAPLRYPFSGSPEREVVGQQANTFFAGRSAFGKYCSRCVSEDVGFHGFAYWRRSHQVGGRVTCPKHGSLLQWVNDPSCFLQSPSYWSNSNISGYCEAVADEGKARFLARYLSLCDNLLDSGPIAGEQEAVNTVEQRAKQMALARGGWHQFGHFLVDYLLLIAEPNCLKEAVPYTSSWRSGSVVHGLMPNKYGKLRIEDQRLCLILVATLFRDRSDFVSMLGELKGFASAACEEGLEERYSKNTNLSGVPERLIQSFVSDRADDPTMAVKFPVYSRSGWFMEEFPPCGDPSRPYVQLGEMMRLSVEGDLTHEEVISQFQGVDRSTANLFKRIAPKHRIDIADSVDLDRKESIMNF